MSRFLNAPRLTINGAGGGQARVWAGPASAWRCAEIVGVNELGFVRVAVDGQEVCSGEATLEGPTRVIARGLPKVRNVLAATGFQDVTLPILLETIAERAGMSVVLGPLPSDRKRHYDLIAAPAYLVIAAALRDWRADWTWLELDGEQLYLGPANQSPYAAIEFELQREQIIWTRERSPGRIAIRMAPMSQLRRTHRIVVNSRRYAIEQIEHRWGETSYTEAVCISTTL